MMGENQSFDEIKINSIHEGLVGLRVWMWQMPKELYIEWIFYY